MPKILGTTQAVIEYFKIASRCYRQQMLNKQLKRRGPSRQLSEGQVLLGIWHERKRVARLQLKTRFRQLVLKPNFR